MPDIAVTKNYGGLDSYEAYRDEIVKRAENPEYFGNPPPSLGFAKGDRPTVGFGYDLQSRKEEHRPEKIVADFEGAGIPLTVRQQAAILFWGGWDVARITEFLTRPGRPLLSQDDRAAIGEFSDRDRTDRGLRARLAALSLSRDQADALYDRSVTAAEQELDRRLRSLPQEVREKLERTDQRAILVDLAYQQPAFIGPSMLGYLRQGDLAGAAFDIAFLDNREALKDLDDRNFARAEAFLGGTLAPRTPEEAKAVLRAMGERYPSIARALVTRQGRPKLAETYRERLERLANESLERLGIQGSLELQPDGEFAVREPIDRAALAGALGVSRLGLTLLTRMAPDGPLDMQVLRPGDRLQLPGSGDQLALLSAGAGLSSDWPNGLLETQRLYKRFQAAREALAAPRAVGHLNFFWETYYEPLFWADERFQRPRDFDVDFSWPPPGSSRPGLGRRSDADDLSDAEIEALERMVAEFQDKLDRLERALEVLRDTPIKVTSDGRWVGTG